MLGPAVGVALALALGVMGLGFLVLWKRAERYAVMPMALAAGFVAGYAKLFDLPAKWDDEIWKWVVVSAVVAGVLLTIGNLLPRKFEWLAWVVMAVGVSCLTGRRIREDSGYYMAALGGGLVLYLAAYWPVARDARLRRVWPVMMLMCGVAAVALVMPFELNHGRMFFVLTALAGLSVAAGFLRPIGRMVAGGGVFPAVIFAVLTTTAAFYMVPDTYPRSVFFWLGAAPLGAGVAWVPWLKRRPWRCAIAATAVAGALLVPAIVIAINNAPPMDV